MAHTQANIFTNIISSTVGGDDGRGICNEQTNLYSQSIQEGSIETKGRFS